MNMQQTPGIDLASEQLLSFGEACRYIPAFRGSRGTAPSTIWRWAFKGVKTTAGELVRLEVLRLGGRWVTSRQALQRFAERLTPANTQPQPIPRSPTARRRDSERADAECSKAGF
jgi:hypothetical protein